MTDFFILDTNVLISAALTPNSTSRKVLDKVMGLGAMASSRETITEFIDVLYRKKFDT
jgi:predicted nucleic acid-binding protein